MPSSIINSDDGLVSGTSGLKSSGGDDGVLSIQNNGTTAVTVDASGRVGIGTSSPSALLTLSSATNATISVNGDSSTNISINRYSSDVSQSQILLRKARGTNASPLAVNSGDSAGYWVVQGYGGTNYRNLSQITTFVDTYTSDTNISSFMGFNVNAGSTGTTERMRITSDGYLRMASGSGGIQFNGDTAAANALDDYEEGTWTGTIKGVTTDPTTPVTATGTYTKIGRQVFARISFSAFNTTGASGTFFISGLPFSSAQPVATGNIMAYDFLTYAGGQNLSPYVSGGSIFAYYMSSNGAWVASTHNAGSNRFLDISVTYNV